MLKYKIPQIVTLTQKNKCEILVCHMIFEN